MRKIITLLTLGMIAAMCHAQFTPPTSVALYINNGSGFVPNTNAAAFGFIATPSAVAAYCQSSPTAQWSPCTSAGGGGGAPSGPAGGDLSGTYPNPTVANANFSALGSGTNTTHGLVVGNGSVLTTAGTGFINANEINGVVVPASAPLLGTDSSRRPIQAVNGSLSGTFAVDTIQPNAAMMVAIGGSNASNAPLAVQNVNASGASGVDFYDNSGTFVGGIGVNNPGNSDPNDFYFYLQTAASEVFSTGGVPRFTLNGLGAAFAEQVTAPVIGSGVTANSDVSGTITLVAGSGTFTFLTSHANAPICVATDTTSMLPVRATSTNTVLTLTGTLTDAINYICMTRN